MQPPETTLLSETLTAYALEPWLQSGIPAEPLIMLIVDVAVQSRSGYAYKGGRRFAALSPGGRKIATGSNIDYQIVHVVYRSTSLIRRRIPLGPYRRPMPRVLGRSWGGGHFLMGEVPLYTSKVGSAAVLHHSLHALKIKTRVLDLPRGRWFISRIGSIVFATYTLGTNSYARSGHVLLP